MTSPFREQHPFEAFEFDQQVRRATVYAPLAADRERLAREIARACGKTGKFAITTAAVTAPEPSTCVFVPELLELSVEDQTKVKALWRESEDYEGLLVLATGQPNDAFISAVTQGRFREDLYYFVSQFPAVTLGPV